MGWPSYLEDNNARSDSDYDSSLIGIYKKPLDYREERKQEFMRERQKRIKHIIIKSNPIKKIDPQNSVDKNSEDPIDEIITEFILRKIGNKSMLERRKKEICQRKKCNLPSNKKIKAKLAAKYKNAFEELLRHT